MIPQGRHSFVKVVQQCRDCFDFLRHVEEVIISGAKNSFFQSLNVPLVKHMLPAVIEIFVGGLVIQDVFQR